MPSIIVPMGAYTIRKKDTAQPNDHITSPGAQTCVVVVLESKHAIAVAHIDSPLIAAQVTMQMVDEMKTMGQGSITARLYGGDYGNPLTSSSSISNALYAELKKRKIAYSHNDYHLYGGFVMATATAFWALSSLGPDSLLISLLCVVLAYKAASITKAILPEHVQPSFLSSNFDVRVNLASGQVRLEKDNEKNSVGLLGKARESLFGEQWSKLKAREELNPIDPANTEKLAMLRV
ncbi:hypothetical protein [Legionella fallonii]|uniref:Uncharacterized protein n=1 Tax=Legionella fallonii LLAP-10 TaxID=1212491 RepID=A0A098G9U6_9GAMM|nr:hypothetical protein [Legionella fallonii]CEG58775.1 protein of unknown function [Legionella fallonii LLAP-10]